MNIVFVNNQHQLGGAETVIQQLRAGLQRHGHACPLHVAHGKNYPPGVVPFYPRLLSRLSHSRLHPLVERLFPRDPWTDRGFRRLAGTRCDLIHLHNFHGDYGRVQSLAHVASRQRLVWTFHAFWGITGGCDHPKACRRYLETCGQCPQVGQWPVGVTDNTADQLQVKLARLASQPIHVIAPSRHLAQKIQESPVGRHWNVHHIPNGVDPTQFGFARKHDPAFRAALGLDPDAITILTVNRNFKDPQKGHPMVHKALSMIPPGAAQIIFAGQHSAWAASQLPAGCVCVDAGYVSSRSALADWYEAADIFLFASPAENFPCVILEAMSARCCVVATPTSGVVEQITSGETGFLSQEIAGKSLGQALRAALAGREARSVCGELARRRVEQEFSEDRMVTRHLALYEELIRA